MAGATILVPVHNGRNNLEPLLAALEPIPAGDDLEVLLVDDGSTDGTWDRILSLTRNPADTDGEPSRDTAARAGDSPPSGAMRIRGLRLKENMGQQYALICGLTACKGRRVVTMDDDLSHPPELVPALLAALDGADLAYASPPARPGRPLRRMASRMHQLHLALLTGTPPRIRVGSYRALSASLADRILDGPASWPYLSAAALGLRPRPVTVMVPSGPWKPSAGGRFSLLKLIRLELRLARYHSGPARAIRNLRAGSRAPRNAGEPACTRTAGEAASRLISERTGP